MAVIEAPARASSKGGGSRRPALSAGAEHMNEVHLVGRLGGEVRETTMPSGDVMVKFHVIVERSARARRERPRAPAVDALGCTGWTPGVRKALATARPGDIVEISGALRRRFQRGAATPTSWYDVEVQRIRKSKAAPEEAVG